MLDPDWHVLALLHPDGGHAPAITGSAPGFPMQVDLGATRLHCAIVSAEQVEGGSWNSRLRFRSPELLASFACDGHRFTYSDGKNHGTGRMGEFSESVEPVLSLDRFMPDPAHRLLVACALGGPLLPLSFVVLPLQSAFELLILALVPVGLTPWICQAYVARSGGLRNTGTPGLLGYAIGSFLAICAAGIAFGVAFLFVMMFIDPPH